MGYHGVQGLSPLSPLFIPDAPFTTAAPGARVHTDRRGHEGGVQLWSSAALLHSPLPPIWGQSRPSIPLAQKPRQSQVGTAWRLGLEGHAQGLLRAETGPNRDLQWFGVLALEVLRGERSKTVGSSKRAGKEFRTELSAQTESEGMGQRGRLWGRHLPVAGAKAGTGDAPCCRRGAGARPGREQAGGTPLGGSPDPLLRSRRDPASGTGTARQPAPVREPAPLREALKLPLRKREAAAARKRRGGTEEELPGSAAASRGRWTPAPRAAPLPAPRA